jgi:uncharacterized membrane protein (DUF485 family)
MIQLSCVASAGYVDGSIGAYLNLSPVDERTEIAKVANHSSHESLVSRKIIPCMFNTVFILHMYVLIYIVKFSYRCAYLKVRISSEVFCLIYLYLI